MGGTLLKIAIFSQITSLNAPKYNKKLKFIKSYTYLKSFKILYYKLLFFLQFFIKISKKSLKVYKITLKSHCYAKELLSVK